VAVERRAAGRPRPHRQQQGRSLRRERRWRPGARARLVAAAANAAGSADGMQPVPCRRESPPPPPPPPPAAAARGGRRCHARPPTVPPTPTRRRRKRRAGGWTRALRLPAARRGRLCCPPVTHTCSRYRGGAAMGRDRTATAGKRAASAPQRCAACCCCAHPSARPLPAARERRSDTQRAAAPLVGTMHIALPSSDAHTINAPPPGTDTAHARQHPRRDAARPRHARRVRPQTASYRLAAAATGDITRRCVAAVWVGRPTARETRSCVALEGVAPQARPSRCWYIRA
jgi:hypothetical protein